MKYQIDPAKLLQASQDSDSFHQTMSPSLLISLTPLLTNFPMSEHSSELVAIGKSLPHLLQRLLQQIHTKEFVNYGELPPAKGKQLAPPTMDTSQILLVQLQEVSLHRRLIPDYNTWGPNASLSTWQLWQLTNHTTSGS